MSLFYIAYHFLLLIGLCLGIYVIRKGNKKYKFITWLLGITLFVELLAEVLIKIKIEFVWAYHLYTPFNYALLALHFKQFFVNKGVKKAVNISIMVFFIFSYSLSILLYNLTDFPGLIITVDGLLIVIICVYYLLNINPEDEKVFFRNANVWISIGLIFFFGGTSFFNGVYTKLFELDKGTALQLFGIINKPLNILLYSSINIGLLCLAVRKKSIILQ